MCARSRSRALSDARLIDKELGGLFPFSIHLEHRRTVAAFACPPVPRVNAALSPSASIAVWVKRLQ
jgi:hypothetical protein